VIGAPRLSKCTRCGLIRSDNAFPRGLDRRRQGTICLQCLRPKEKKCNGCKTVKPIHGFCADYSSADLHSSHCKECQRAARKRSRDKRRDGRGRPRIKSEEQAKTRQAAMLAQKRNPDADYHANYRGVVGPLIFGCVGSCPVVARRDGEWIDVPFRGAA